MSDIKVAFWGLCCVVERKTCYEVVLPTGDRLPEPNTGDCKLTEAPHVATLAIPVKHLAKVIGWAPVAIVEHDGDQLACWHVRALGLVEFGVEGKASNDLENDETLHFGQYHGAQLVKERADLLTLGYTVLVLGHGNLESDNDDDNELKALVSIHGNKTEHKLARRVRWSTDADGLTISSREGSISVTSARDHERHKCDPHPTTSRRYEDRRRAKRRKVRTFGFYYTLFNKSFLCEQRVELYAPDEDPFNLGSDVYDCVPPTGGS